MDEGILARAVELIREAKSILIGAGAGMGVDSGLPDFRGQEGFWRAYPPYRHLGLAFVELANPAWFDRDPRLAWGFYGHRLQLYRSTMPHLGFQILRRWFTHVGNGYIFTSNVDGQFQKAGFDESRLVECHGSLHYLQCTRCCTGAIWSAEGVQVDVALQTFRASEPLPRCPDCGRLARPNVLMFGDGWWCETRTAAQGARFKHWLENLVGDSLVVIECGAGLAVPTVRHTCESIAARFAAPLIRINPREPEGPPGTLPLAAGALEALVVLAGRLQDGRP
ncbi:MAG: NAD-dependent deacetylase [Gammaproteobacteria bacterium]